MELNQGLSWCKKNFCDIKISHSESNFSVLVTRVGLVMRGKANPLRKTAPRRPGPTHCLGFTITSHYTRSDSSGRVISPTHRYLSDNTQHSQATDIRTICGIRTRNPSERVPADPRRIPRGHWDRHTSRILMANPSHIRNFS